MGGVIEFWRDEESGQILVQESVYMFWKCMDGRAYIGRFWRQRARVESLRRCLWM